MKSGGNLKPSHKIVEGQSFSKGNLGGAMSAGLISRSGVGIDDHTGNRKLKIRISPERSDTSVPSQSQSKLTTGTEALTCSTHNLPPPPQPTQNKSVLLRVI